MNEWTVVTIIITLVSFIITIIRSILPLNTAITELTEQMKFQNCSLKELTTDNSNSHKRLWECNDVQNKMLNDHEVRIVVLERGEKK